jgi:hypothetical protein
MRFGTGSSPHSITTQGRNMKRGSQVTTKDRLHPDLLLRLAFDILDAQRDLLDAAVAADDEKIKRVALQQIRRTCDLLDSVGIQAGNVEIQIPS